MIEHMTWAFDMDLHELTGKIGEMGDLAQKQITSAMACWNDAWQAPARHVP